MKLIFLVVALSVCGLAVGCGKPKSPASNRPVASPNAKHLAFHGKVTGVDKANQSISVMHDDVMEEDGKTLYMKSMDMPFPVPDQEVFSQIAVGDEVGATLVVDRSAFWLEGIALSKSLAGPGGQPDAPRPGEPPPGTPMVNAQLINQDGKRVQLNSYRGKVLVLTFLYTRCPLPEYCSLMASNFVAIDKALQKNPDQFNRTHLLSISIDPQGDTPQVLKAYGTPLVRRNDESKFDHWEFVTGIPDEIRKAATFFGLEYEPQNGQITHSLRTAIITPDGKVYKIYRGNEWRVDQLQADLNTLLNGAGQ
jgi:protein SCO1/2